jgi:hypothetical protein
MPEHFRFAGYPHWGLNEYLGGGVGTSRKQIDEPNGDAPHYKPRTQFPTGSHHSQRRRQLQRLLAPCRGGGVVAVRPQLLRGARKAWHGVRLQQPDWSQHSHSLAFSAELPEENLSLYIIFNAYWEALEFELPAHEHGDWKPWRRWIDTSLESPNDIQDWPAAPPVTGRTYLAAPRSVAVLIVVRSTRSNT